MNRKRQFLLCSSLCFFSVLVCANPQDDMEELFESPSDELLYLKENNYSADDESDSFEDSFIVDMHDDSSASTTTSADSSSRGYYYMFPDQKGDFYSELDFLYWTVSESGLYYALTKTKQVPGVGEVPFDGQSADIYGYGSRHDVEFDWTPAVRASMGYEFTNTPWYVDGEYTYFNTRKDHTINAPQGPFAYLTSLGLLQGTDTDCEQAVSKIHFQYQSARLVFGTSWHPIEKLGVHMEFGPKFSIVNQNWNVTYFGDGEPGSANQKNTLNWNYWGGGLNLLLGLDANLGMGFGIDAGAGLSAMYGPFKSRYYTTRTEIPSDDQSQTLSISRSDYNEVLWESQLYTDLSWSYYLKEVAFRLSMGYEFNVLNNINEQLRVTGVAEDVNSGSDISQVSKPIYLHGLVAKFGVGF